MSNSEQAGNVIGKLTDLQFYRWRLAVEKFQHAQTRVKLAESALQLSAVEVTLAQSRQATKKLELMATQGKEKIVTTEWHAVRDALSSELNLLLEHVGINEDTLEILELEKQPQGGG